MTSKSSSSKIMSKLISHKRGGEVVSGKAILTLSPQDTLSTSRAYSPFTRTEPFVWRRVCTILVDNFTCPLRKWRRGYWSYSSVTMYSIMRKISTLLFNKEFNKSRIARYHYKNRRCICKCIYNGRKKTNVYKFVNVKSVALHIFSL